MTPPRWYMAFWSAIFAGYCAFWIGINMADTVVLNTQAGTNGKTLATLEGTAQSVTGELVPASDAAIVGWVRRKVVTLTNAQIKALPTTPITLISAPASGYWNHVLSASYRLQAGSGAYTNINATYSALVVQTASDNWLVTPIVNDSGSTPALGRVSTFLGVAADYLVHAGEYVEGADSSSGGADWGIPSAEALTSDFNGIATELALDNNGSGDLTGGHASNTLKVTVYYIVEPL